MMPAATRFSLAKSCSHRRSVVKPQSFGSSHCPTGSVPIAQDPSFVSPVPMLLTGANRRDIRPSATPSRGKASQEHHRDHCPRAAMGLRNRDLKTRTKKLGPGGQAKLRPTLPVSAWTERQAFGPSQQVTESQVIRSQAARFLWWRLFPSRPAEAPRLGWWGLI